ncbi:hypothetical protein CRE_09252 [Caenorhabditis remanei]|uniref:Serpentine Receptor, class H n=1 Tax=Caenorhabditis remanei TaxID=31234 RepID=E3LHS5_CAERE|nr:hypothetical protein CRE_09252 [Caenorhabditis remanei]
MFPISFLYTSKFLTNACYFLTTIGVPIHLFGAYLILCKTPKRMGSVKWYMLNVHFWSSLLDFSLTFLVIPFMLFPFAAGWPFGIFAWLEINPAIQTTVIVTEIGLTILSILVLFENRYTFLSSNNKVWARTRSYTIRLLHVVAVTYFIPFNFLIPNQEIAISAITQTLPTLRTFYSGSIFVLTQDATLVVVVTAFKVIFEFFFIGLLVVLTFLDTIRQNKASTLSQFTMTLQRKFFVSITIQTVIPFCIIMMPLLYCVFSVAENHFNQAMNNLCFIIISSHGIISTTAMTLIHKPYRDVLFPCHKHTKVRRMTLSGLHILHE